MSYEFRTAKELLECFPLVGSHESITTRFSSTRRKPP